ncbi:Penicillinase repressor [Posidoniimonas corsicana]|uniref:Penicillinase repressor n=1 Tax=Posidoniimonas corsicana TaxID=1938618 RepID=A0A5C5VJS0_9BACT|nr:BlaI/MecI/CopY family transcriptional regulator [Posidoniimonas corsicana]TWT38129.1 Penicillinase repressor [Posidoniimonas corsicana]
MADRIPEPSRPTQRELEALKVLWHSGEAPVRDIADQMNQQGEQLAYTTVLSLLQVMEQKGLVAHRRDGKAYLYRPLLEKGRAYQGLATDFLERVFDGAVDEYLVHAIQGKKLSAEELDGLEAMIAAARKQNQTRSKGRKK